MNMGPKHVHCVMWQHLPSFVVIVMSQVLGKRLNHPAKDWCYGTRQSISPRRKDESRIHSFGITRGHDRCSSRCKMS